jgi:hypothetical protein
MVNAPVSGVEPSAASWRFLGSSPRFVVDFSAVHCY